MASLDAFMNRFASSARRDWRVDGPAFTLILGAGASRSSGVPMAGEMVAVLERLAEIEGIRLSRKPIRESALSWTFRRVTERLPWVSEFSDYGREFIMACISRAAREPNLAHLVAAHLCTAQIIGDIVTTNFDDLAPAAFWSLPMATAFFEPHVIYHPQIETAPRAAREVPLIIKAHGHHTVYGLGIIDREIRALAPCVKQILARRPDPEIGYLVVGYSGGWSDGVMAALSDPKVTAGKTIYWFFTGRPPEGANLEVVKKNSDVKFIKIVDADVLFLRMWHEVHMDEERNNPPLFEGFHLFNLRRNTFSRRSTPEAVEKWWPVRTLPETREGMRNHPRLLELRHELLPLLNTIDTWDDECLVFDCAPAAFRQKIRRRGGATSWIRPPEFERLRERIPLEIDWTRRNRKLLRLALTTHVDPVMPYILLEALCQTHS